MQPHHPAVVTVLLSLSSTLSAVPAASGQDTPEAPVDRPLIGFDEPGVASDWVTVNDGVMGGRSRGGPSFADGVMTFAGSTNTNGGGFSSVRTRDREWALDDADGLRLRVRGDGRTYMLDLRTDATVRRMRVAYRATFDTIDDGAWHDVWVPFDAVNATVRGRDVNRAARAFDPADVRSIGLMIYDGNDGPFELAVDGVWAYRGEPGAASGGEPAAD